MKIKKRNSNRIKLNNRAVELGYKDIKDAIIDMRKNYIYLSEICEKFDITISQYEWILKTNKINTNVRDPETMSPFEYIDSNMQRKTKAKVMPRVKELGYDYFSEAVFELRKTKTNKQICDIFSTTVGHTYHVYQRVKRELQYRSGEKKRPKIKKRVVKAIKKDKNVKECSRPGCSNKVAAHLGYRFLCESCYNNASIYEGFEDHKYSGGRGCYGY